MIKPRKKMRKYYETLLFFTIKEMDTQDCFYDYTYGNIEHIKLLFEKGADIEAKNNDGNTHLIRASFKGRYRSCKILNRERS